MGCDIHINIFRISDEEIRLKKINSALETNEEVKKFPMVQMNYNLYDGRNYRLFSRLAGVRGSHDPLYEYRGKPDILVDENEPMEFSTCGLDEWFYNGDLHSHTYIWLDELVGDIRSGHFEDVGDYEGEFKMFIDSVLELENHVLNELKISLNSVIILIAFDN